MTDRPKTPAFDADEAEALRAIGWRARAGSSSCPDSSLLLAAGEGVLDEDLAAKVQAHVASCATCQLLMKDLTVVLAEDPDDKAIERTRGRIVAGQSQAVRRSAPYIWLGAGGLALAAGLILFMVLPKTPVPPATDVQLTRATPPIPSVFNVDRPSIPPGEVELTVRGESATHISLEDRISAALDKADKGDFEAALSDLASLQKSNATSRIVALALGAVQLRAGQNADAVTTLERARQLKGEIETADEAGWFLSIALVRTAGSDKARPILEDICSHHGTRGVSACSGVAEIDRNKSAR